PSTQSMIPRDGTTIGRIAARWDSQPCKKSSDLRSRRMADEINVAPSVRVRLQRAIDPSRDHIRGGRTSDSVVSVVFYGDYLCPYCRRLRPVLDRLRKAFGERLVYVFRNFPNERANPGSTFVAVAAEAAAAQGRFWEVHDELYGQEPPLREKQVLEL